MALDDSGEVTAHDEDTLFAAAKEEILRAVDEFDEGVRSNLVLVAPPFYGLEAFLDRMAKGLYPRAQPLDGADLYRDGGLPFESDKSIGVISGIERLYRRRIGGFGAMKRFINHVASSPHLFIASCSVYSWDYLQEILPLGRIFPRQIRLPVLDAKDLMEIHLSLYGEEELEFVIEKEAPMRVGCPIRLGRRSIAIRGWKVEVPVPEVRIKDLKDLRPCIRHKTEPPPSKRVFFERLARISGGNPGVAEILWKRALEYPLVRSETLQEVPSIDLDFDHSFILSIILSKGSLELDEIEEVAGRSMEILYGLQRQGLISFDGKTISMRPDALKGAFDHLRRLKLVV
ncbi:MAG: hypothetical protein JW986_10040 [Methanotrichaceae archaeon]|nr:hypothetical protein [Methanotrichaceae archaeon]